MLLVLIGGLNDPKGPLDHKKIITSWYCWFWLGVSEMQKEHSSSKKERQPIMVEVIFTNYNANQLIDCFFPLKRICQWYRVGFCELIQNIRWQFFVNIFLIYVFNFGKSRFVFFYIWYIDCFLFYLFLCLMTYQLSRVV